MFPFQRAVKGAPVSGWPSLVGLSMSTTNMMDDVISIRVDVLLVPGRTFIC